MRSRVVWASVMVAILCLCIGGLQIVRFARNRPEQVRYVSHTGDNAITVKMSLAAPTTNLDSVPETIMAASFVTGDLLSIEGELAEPASPSQQLVLVEFVKRLPTGVDVIGNTAMKEIPSRERTLRILVNVPKEDGEYSLRLQWLGGHYIARGKVIVRPRQ